MQKQPSRLSLTRPSYSYFQKGFTLLELLVSVSIITLLIGTGIPAFRHFGRVSQLDQAADQVKGAILDARAYALGPRAEKGAAADWYQISFDQVAEKYTLSETASTTLSTTSLPPFIQISSATSPIGFSISGQGAVVNPSDLDTTVTPPKPRPFATAVGNPTVVLINSQLGSATKRTISVNRQTGAVSIAR